MEVTTDWRYCLDCGRVYDMEVPNYVMDGRHHCDSRHKGLCSECIEKRALESRRLTALWQAAKRAGEAVRNASQETGADRIKAISNGQIVEWAVRNEIIKLAD